MMMRCCIFRLIFRGDHNDVCSVNAQQRILTSNRRYFDAVFIIFPVAASDFPMRYWEQNRSVSEKNWNFRG